jgi:hypothetical protein
MVIMAGIDLLAKFYAGSDQQTGVGQRIRRFCRDFIFSGDPSADEFSDVLYVGCRNPMLHSFTLHSTEYRISLACGLGRSMVSPVTGRQNAFLVNVDGLFAGYIASIAAYRSALDGSEVLQRGFAALFPRYGGIAIQPVIVHRRPE